MTAGVLVTASRTARAQAERRGIPMIETAIEAAILAGRKRHRTLGGVLLDGQLRHVVVNDSVGAIVAKRGRTGGGRQRFHAVRLIRIQCRRPARRVAPSTNSA
jgi:hypothetical protein